MSFLEKQFPHLLLAPALIPLVVCGGLYYPYLFPKVVLFYALVLLALAAFLFLSARGMPFYFGRLTARITWIPGLLLVLAYFTSLLGIDFYKSFWSIFGRGDGLLMLTLSVASFYLLLIYADRAFFLRLLRTVAGVGTVAAIWALIQWLVTGGRIGGSIGNPAFLAGYLALSFFVTLIVAEKSASREWRRYAYVGAGLQVLAILLTATRGTMLALVAAGVVALLYGAVGKTGAVRRRSVAILAALLVAATGFFFTRDFLAQSSFSPVARIAQISLQDPDIAHRLFVWEHMLTEIGKRPFLGYGAEHIAFLFDRFYDPGRITEQWFDRSHNAYLDYAAQFGVFGALLYLGLIIALISSGLRYGKRPGAQAGDERVGFLIALAALTYALQNFFVFDTISSWWLFLALLALTLSQMREASKTTLPLRPMPRTLTGAAIVLVLAIIPVSLLPLLANYDLARGYYYHLIDVPKANAYFKKGLALRTYGDVEYGYQLHTIYTERQAAYLSGEERVDAYKMAKEVLTENYTDYPYDARVAVYLSHVLDSAPPEAPADPAFVRQVAIRALELSPKRAQTWFVLANLSIGSAKDLPQGPEKTARYQEAVKILEKYVELVPSLAEPHFVLADLYTALGNMAQAKAEAALGDARYTTEDVSTARRAALFFERVGNWERAAFYLQSVVDQDETDVVFYYDLAKVHYMQGQYAEALRIVKDLRARSPETLSTDPAFMEAITSYESQN